MSIVTLLSPLVSVYRTFLALPYTATVALATRLTVWTAALLFFVGVVPVQVYDVLFIDFPIWLLGHVSGWFVGILIAVVAYLYFQSEAICASWRALKRRFRGEKLLEITHEEVEERVKGAVEVKRDNEVVLFLAEKHDVTIDDVIDLLAEEDFVGVDRYLSEVNGCPVCADA